MISLDFSFVKDAAIALGTISFFMNSYSFYKGLPNLIIKQPSPHKYFFRSRKNENLMQCLISIRLVNACSLPIAIEEYSIELPKYGLFKSDPEYEPLESYKFLSRDITEEIKFFKHDIRKNYLNPIFQLPPYGAIQGYVIFPIFADAIDDYTLDGKLNVVTPRKIFSSNIHLYSAIWSS